MEITENVILDLMPLYLAKESSVDSTKMVDAYLKSNPRFAEKIKLQNKRLESFGIEKTLKMEEEMSILQKTKKLVRRRSIIMGHPVHKQTQRRGHLAL